MELYYFLIFIFQCNAWPPVIEKSPYRTVTTAYRQVELYHVQDGHMEIILAEQLCREAGMYLPDPMDINESNAIFRDENEELIIYESGTGLQRVSDTNGEYSWIATSNQRRPELFWAEEKDYMGHENNVQWFPTPRENFGLCLHREYVESGGSALFFDVCDRRIIANFLCEIDDLDFAFRTYLNDSVTGFDAFLGDNMPTLEWFKWLKSFNFANYVEVNLTNNWNAMVENQIGLTKEEIQIIINRKPRIISEAAEQCQKEGSVLLTTTTLNNSERFRQFLQMVDVSWFWVNGYQDNDGQGIMREFVTNRQLLVKDLPRESIHQNWNLQLTSSVILLSPPYKDQFV